MITLTPEQIAELRAALAKATPGPWRTFAGINDDGVWAACGPEHEADYDADETNEPGDRAEQAAQRDAELIALMRTALPALLDAAERCARLSEAIPFTVKGFAGELPAIDILENVATQLTTATRERDEMARELERAREAMKKLHPRPSHGLLGDIGCVADRVGSNSDAWEELLRERDAAIERAEAAEKERDEIVSAIIGHDNEDMKHDPKSVAQLVKDVLIERDDLTRRLGEATELLRDALRNPPGQLTIQAAGTERDIRRWLATLTTPPADGDHAKTEQIERGDHAKGGG